MYLNETRRDLLFSVDLSTDPNISAAAWFQRGVALVAWSSKIGHRPV
jgi:hypothetical protein